ncbi:MAG: hypothetical protein BWY89_02008 [Bacteroidetes bacterium ADurb.BinA012]|nr:MAG: hypothetical protein BWY89_02008 [Bacteroidetes bacterium ADurb.BinA012]
MVVVNQVDNGVQPEGEEGKRYTADFTVVDSLDAADAINAVTRITADPVMDQLVVDNIEVNGKPAIETRVDYPTKVASTIFPSLPSSGTLKMGEIYSYGNGAVMVRQTHERTIYTPEQTPALFSFYRDNASAELAWMEGEKVEAGWKRTYGGKTYECLQAHQTQADWTPTATIGVLWKEVVIVVDIPVWVQPTGAHDAYQKGKVVWYPTLNSTKYESLIDANVWSPVAYAAGWRKL